MSFDDQSEPVVDVGGEVQDQLPFVTSVVGHHSSGQVAFVDQVSLLVTLYAGASVLCVTGLSVVLDGSVEWCHGQVTFDGGFGAVILLIADVVLVNAGSVELFGDSVVAVVVVGSCAVQPALFGQSQTCSVGLKCRPAGHWRQVGLTRPSSQ